MKITSANPSEIFRVALAMRPRDFVEFQAVSSIESYEDMARALTSRYSGNKDILCAANGDKPIAIGGLIFSRPNVGTLLFYATDSFREIALPLTRFIKRELFPRYEAAGVHRIECVSLEGYAEVHAWLELLGLRRETGPLRGYGRNGEPYAQFARVSAHVR